MNFLDTITTTVEALGRTTSGDVINYIICVCAIIISYLIGSIPFGVVIGKLICHKDIREYGSKNIGSTNAIRVLGKPVGFLVFFFDVFKGAFIILIMMLLKTLNVYHTPIEYLWYGAAAIIGHSFSIFLKFKGGKAVATSLGVVLVLSPMSAINCLIVFLLILYITGYVSLASTGATLTVVTTGWLLFAFGLPYGSSTNFLEYYISNPGLGLCILFCVMGLLIIIKHIKNYKRLLNGTESNFKKAKKEKKEALAKAKLEEQNNLENKENLES